MVTLESLLSDLGADINSEGVIKFKNWDFMKDAKISISIENYDPEYGDDYVHAENVEFNYGMVKISG